MKTLYKFYQSYGRNGVLEGVFVADDSEIHAAVGKTVHFGEALGKHSQVQGILQENDLTPLTRDAGAIEVIEHYLHGGTGWNPLNYILCPHNLNLNEAHCEVCICDHDEISETCKKCKEDANNRS